jgi:aminoglycoside phosphotransferase
MAGWWTPAVHDLLRYLHDVGYPAPQPIGVDEQGREVLSFLPGSSGREEMHRVAADDGLRAAAIALRAYHDSVASYRPPPNAEWCIGVASLAPGDIICHGDFSPQNLVWRDQSIVGVIDWDLAYPGPPLDDVAFTLIYSVPMRPDSPPNANERIRLFADAYGIRTDGLVDAAIERQLKYANHLRVLHDRGFDAPWVTAGAIDWAEDWSRWCDQNRHRFE